MQGFKNSTNISFYYPGNDEKTSPKEQSESSRNIQHLEFLLNQALDEDEQDNLDEALENYMEAVETGLSIASRALTITFPSIVTVCFYFHRKVQ